MWVLGRGSNIPDVIDSAETRFAAGTADEVVATLGDFGVGRQERDSFVDAIASLWDELSAESSLRVLQRLSPRRSEHPLLRREAGVWGALALVIPEQWLHAFEELPDDGRIALLEAVSPLVAEGMPEQAARDLLVLARREGIDDTKALVVAALLHRFQEPSGSFEDMWALGPNTLADISRRHPSLVPLKVVDRVVKQLVKAIRSSMEEARGGSFGFGGAVSEVSLGTIASRMTSIPETVWNCLITKLQADWLPPEMRFDAASGLALLGYRTTPPDSVAEALRNVSQDTRPSLFSEISARLLRTAVLRAKAPMGLSESEVDEVAADVRDSDPRVRDIALQAALMVPLQGPSLPDLASTAIVAGIFDPVPRVVIACLRATRDLPSTFGKTWPLVPGAERRLLTLFDEGSRELRAELAMTARAGGMSVESERALLEKATRDRSWVVRDAVR
jgi:hypothetical protein